MLVIARNEAISAHAEINYDDANIKQKPLSNLQCPIPVSLEIASFLAMTWF
jgi:hypothetical protein